MVGVMGALGDPMKVSAGIPFRRFEPLAGPLEAGDALIALLNVVPDRFPQRLLGAVAGKSSGGVGPGEFTLEGFGCQSRVAEGCLSGVAFGFEDADLRFEIGTDPGQFSSSAAGFECSIRVIQACSGAGGARVGFNEAALMIHALTPAPSSPGVQSS